jgi:hypothetical protein
MTKGIITIAVGKKYIAQAKALSRSCALNSPHSIRAVVTDLPDALVNYYDIIVPYNPAYGDPFATKTRLYLYTPFEKTLYMDADSLVVHNLDAFWDSLEGRPFAYTGTVITSGVWYFNVAETIAKLGLLWVPQFNSGMFLFDKSDAAKTIFDTAFTSMQHYKQLGIAFFRAEMLPDEPFLSIALAQSNIKPVEEYGRFSRTLIGAQKIRIDIIKRLAFFIKNGQAVFPLAVHFCGRFGGLLFWRERVKLFLYFNPPFNVLVTNLLAFIKNSVKRRQGKK